MLYAQHRVAHDNNRSIILTITIFYYYYYITAVAYFGTFYFPTVSCDYNYDYYYCYNEEYFGHTFS